MKLIRKLLPAGAGRRRYLAAAAWAALGVLLLTAVFKSFVLIMPSGAQDFSFSGLDFREEDRGHPRLKLLREREKLLEVTAPAHSQFDELVRLRHWARKQWKPGSRFYYPAWDAVEILGLARRGNRGFCAQFAVVFLQACLSVGLHARYVDLPGHFTVEVWSDEHSKWVVMDPYFDVYYEKDGVPLGGIELCDLYWKGESSGLMAVAHDGERFQPPDGDLQLYAKYSVVLRNDHLSVPVQVMRGGKAWNLERLKDYRRYPQIGGSGKGRLGIMDHFVGYRSPFAKEQFTDRPLLPASAFDWKRNIAVMSVSPDGGRDGAARVALVADGAPTFMNFLFRRDDDGWESSGDRMVLALRPGMNEMYARVLTAHGRLGPPSLVRIFYKPSLQGLISARAGGGESAAQAGGSSAR